MPQFSMRLFADSNLLRCVCSSKKAGIPQEILVVLVAAARLRIKHVVQQGPDHMGEKRHLGLGRGEMREYVRIQQVLHRPPAV